MTILEKIQNVEMLHRKYLEAVNDLMASISHETADWEAAETLPDVETIQNAVSDYYRIPRGAMRSRIRTESWCQPRMVAVYIASRITNHTHAEIARSFGRAHNNVVHARRAVNDRILTESAFKTEVEAIEAVASARLVELAKHRIAS